MGPRDDIESGYVGCVETHQGIDVLVAKGPAHLPIGLRMRTISNLLALSPEK
jgi:hypothetical protein